MYQGFEAERQPEVGHGRTGADEVVRRDADDGQGGAIETDGLAQHGGIAAKSSLPVIFTDENRRRGRELRKAYGFESAAAQGRDPEHRKVVLRHHEGAGELCIVRAWTQQAQSCHQRPGLRTALAAETFCPGEPQPLDRKGDDATERTEMIAVRFVIRITESGIDHAGLQTQRDVDRRAGVARVERSHDERPVRREDSRIDADTERQGKNRHGGEPGIAEQGARAETQVLEYRFEQDHGARPLSTAYDLNDGKGNRDQTLILVPSDVTPIEIVPPSCAGTPRLEIIG